MSAKCPACGKTAYAMESIKANGTLYHKRCFKCDVCKRALNTDTVFPHSETGKIYCKTHYPQPKNLQAVDTIEMRRAKEGPKLDTYNKQIQGKSSGMQGNLQSVDTIEMRRAKNGPKLDTYNKQIQGKNSGMQGNLQSADTIELKRAKEGPKLGTVNTQIIGGDEVHKNLQVADMQTTKALAAPKLDTVSAQVLGNEDTHKNLQVADRFTASAQNAPKLDVEGGISRSEAKHNFNGVTGF